MPTEGVRTHISTSLSELSLWLQVQPFVVVLPQHKADNILHMSQEPQVRVEYFQRLPSHLLHNDPALFANVMMLLPEVKMELTELLQCLQMLLLPPR
eukprot:15479633-Alexandrium_andersonii.AAC.1